MTDGLKLEQQQRLYDTLKRIARGYMTPTQIRRDSRQAGLDYDEYLEMSYENIQSEAAAAIKGVRRPKGRTHD